MCKCTIRWTLKEKNEHTNIDVNYISELRYEHGEMNDKENQ
jgi:hypothetical protein